MNISSYSDRNILRKRKEKKKKKGNPEPPKFISNVSLFLRPKHCSENVTWVWDDKHSTDRYIWSCSNANSTSGKSRQTYMLYLVSNGLEITTQQVDFVSWSHLWVNNGS